jgi:hypothetical protein
MVAENMVYDNKQEQISLQNSADNNPNVITVYAIGDSDGKCGGTGPALALFDGTVPDDTFAFFSKGQVVR